MAPISVHPHITKSQRSEKTSRHISKARTDDKLGVYLRLYSQGKSTLSRIDDQYVQTLPPNGTSTQYYSFTQVFDGAPQSEIFKQVGQPVAEKFISSDKDGLIFTYGITGSGKTYTMQGGPSDPGLIFRTIDFVFNSIGDQLIYKTKKCLVETGHNVYQICNQETLYPDLAPPKPSCIKFWQNRAKETASIEVDPSNYYCLYISLIELYNKYVYDLFDDQQDKKPRIVDEEGGKSAYVKDARELEVKSADQAVQLYLDGVTRRHTSRTECNRESSRGHCVLILKLVRVCKTSHDHIDDKITLNHLCLVDLAGSERSKRSGATGETQREAGNINNSLGSLRNCIRALRDRDLTSCINYRECTLTRLFKSYLQGNGIVRMVLCVKPTRENYDENKFALEFGILTQDVPVNYASAPKKCKLYKETTEDIDMLDMNSHLSDEEFIATWVERLKSERDQHKQDSKAILGAQREVRQKLLTTVSESDCLKRQLEKRTNNLKSQEYKLLDLKKMLESTQKSRYDLESHIDKLHHENQLKEHDIDKLKKQIQSFERLHVENEKLNRVIKNLIQNDEDRTDIHKKFALLLKKMGRAETLNTEPSAPEMESVQCSSPIRNRTSSTTETDTHTHSHTPPTTSNTSSEALDFQEHHPQSHIASEALLSSPTNGVPVLNPRHNRSLSVPGQWIHHRPSGTIDTGTVLKPKFKNGRSVKNLRSSDILRKDAAGYSVVHQNADSNGEVETSVYKGQIITTVCGGAQVILNDIETLRQLSPRRKRSSSEGPRTS